MHRRMLLTERLLNKARRTARYKGYRRKRAFYIPERNDDMELTELLNKMGFPENWKNITRYHLK